jgi:hypothetical protein
MELTNAFLIAPCGINCRLCMAFEREMNVCPGCRGEDTRKMKSCRNCRIKNCENLVTGRFIYCFECDAFPCELVKHLDKRYRTKYGTQPIENLIWIKTEGIERFVESENTKWTCPECGAMLCMHRPQCRLCGYSWNQ